MADDQTPQTPPTPEELYPAQPTGHIGSAKFMTPDQALANRRLAMMLMSQGKGGAQQDVHHWAQGLSNMANDLVGGLLMRRSLGGENEQLERAAETADWAPEGAPGGGISPPQASLGEKLFGGVKRMFGGGADTTTPTTSTAADGDPLEARKRAISSIESGSPEGNYRAIGPQTRSGDHAYGRYQVMGNEIPGLTAKYLGRPMNIADFVHNKEAQDAVFKGEFGRLEAKYGPEGAARAWFAGEHGMHNPNANDRYHTVGWYGNTFAKNLAHESARATQQPTGGRALGYAAEQPPTAPTPQAASAAPAGPTEASPVQVASTDPAAGVKAAGVRAMDQQLPAIQAKGANSLTGAALVGQPPNVQVAASRAVPGMGAGGAATGAGAPPGGQIPENLRPVVRQITPQQLHEAMRNPYMPWEDKRAMQEAYRLQFQPRKAINAIGQEVILPPQGQAGSGLTITPIQQQKMKSGSSEVDIPYTFQATPRGPVQTPVPSLIFGGGGGGAPGGALGGPAPAAPGNEPPPNVPSIGPSTPSAGGKRSEAEPEAAPPTRLAALETGTMSDAGPPGMFKAPPAQEAATKEPATKTAQAGGFQIPQPLQALRDYDIQKNVQEEGAKKFQDEDIKKEADTFDSAQKTYNAALTLRPQLLEQKALVEDPRFKQGPGYELKMVPDLVRSFFGGKEANDALAANSAFSKNVAGTILGQMKSFLEGLGQVRVKEMELLDTASASPHNTLAANRMIIDMAQRYQDQMANIGKITNAYQQGWRPDAHGNWSTRTNERPTNAGLNEVITRYRQNNPIYNDKEIAGLLDKFKEYKNVEDDAKKAQGAGPALGTKPPELSPEKQDELKRLKEKQQQLKKTPTAPLPIGNPMGDPF